MNTKRSIILVTAFVTTIGAAMYPIFIYPLKNIDHYKEVQTRNRAGINQEDIQPGNMKVWSDPFDRKGHKKDN